MPADRVTVPAAFADPIVKPPPCSGISAGDDMPVGDEVVLHAVLPYERRNAFRRAPIAKPMYGQSRRRDGICFGHQLTTL